MLRLLGKQERRQHRAILSEVSMSSDLYGELTDAGRTALEIVRRQRAGDLRGIVDLVSTYGDDGKWLIFGAMASIVKAGFPAAVHRAAGMVSQQCGCEITDALALRRARAFSTSRPAEEIAAQVLRGELQLR
jgi:hypothetical protein